jgi:hypothetical protein
VNDAEGECNPIYISHIGYNGRGVEFDTIQWEEYKAQHKILTIGVRAGVCKVLLSSGKGLYD